MANTKQPQPGEMYHRLTFFTLDDHKNSKGETVGQSTTPYATVWARKRDQPGDEIPVKDRETAFNRSLFDIRFRGDLKPTMSCKCGDVVYDIENIRQDWGRNQWLTIEAKAHD